MLLETQKERVCINKNIGQNEKEIKVDGDVIVNDVKPDVLKVISVDGIPCIYKKEVIEGKVRIDGCINTYIIYLADDENGSVRGLNTVLDFTQMIDIDGCNSGMSSIEKINIKNIECKILNSRKINVSALIGLSIKVFSNEDIEIISSIKDLDDIHILNNSITIDSLIGSGCNKAIAKDTISVDMSDEIAEIMNIGIRIINRDIKISYNKILAKADAEINIIYLTEDNRIKNITTRIPIMGFVDIENITEDSMCDVNYQIKNLVIKPNSGDTNSIFVEVEVEISCYAYEPKSIDLIKDLYSIKSDLSFKNKEIKIISEKNNITQSCKINEQINVPEVEGGKIINVKSTPKLLNTTIKNGKVLYEGEVDLELLLENVGGVISKNVNLPFNFEVMSECINENFLVETDIEVKQDDFIVNNSNIDLKIELEFRLNVCKSENLNIINEITQNECRDNNIYSMVIYFVKTGDTLWGIAKKFKSTIEDIARVNNIEDENKIYPGQQLYIPKFVSKRVAV